MEKARGQNVATKFYQKFLYCDSTLIEKKNFQVKKKKKKKIKKKEFPREELQYKDIWQNLDDTLYHLYTREKRKKSGEKNL